MGAVKRRRILVILAGIIVVAVLVIVFWLGEKEPPNPEYGGKKLSAWLEQYVQCVETERNWWLGFPRTNVAVVAMNKTRAAEAVRQMGTNAVPWMTEKIAHEGSGLKLDWASVWGSCVRVKPILVYRPKYTRRDLHADCALYGFSILG